MTFFEVEQAVKKLKSDLEKGTLTRDQVEQRLKELMIQDKEGNWWMVGFASGKWYCNPGWIKSESPGQPPVFSSRPQTSIAREQGMNPWLIFLLGLGLGAVISWGAAAFSLGGLGAKPTPEIFTVVETVEVEKVVTVEVVREVEVVVTATPMP